MGLKYLWDTNTVIYFLQKQFPPKAEETVTQTLAKSIPSISVFTEIELLGWKTATEKDIEILNVFIRESFVFELDKEIKLKTIELRKSGKIKLPDAMIAATALVNELILISRNSADFTWINGLNLLNPWES